MTTTGTGKQISALPNDAHLGAVKNDPILISTFTSSDDWGAITASRLVVNRRGKLHDVSLADITAMNHPTNATELALGKRSGGTIELMTRGGLTIELCADNPGTFIGLVNVFRYIVRANKNADSGSSRSESLLR